MHAGRKDLAALGRRERQIVEAVHRLGRAAVGDVLAAIPDPPSYSAVRAMLNKLEAKGYLRHEEDGPRYMYVPVLSTDRVRRTALRHMVDTFFEGSPEQAVLALLELSDRDLPADTVAELRSRIDAARKEGR